MLTKDQFSRGFVILTRAYPKQEIPKGTADVYFQTLNRRQLTPKEYEDAINACIGTLKFFPAISEILESMIGDADSLLFYDGAHFDWKKQKDRYVTDWEFVAKEMNAPADIIAKHSIIKPGLRVPRLWPPKEIKNG